MSILQQIEGKRVLPSGGPSKGAVIAIVIVSLLVLLFVGSYVGLCAYVRMSAHVLPNVSAAGVPLSGLTQEEAAATLERTVTQRYAGQSLTFSCSGDQFTVPGELVTADSAFAAQTAWRLGRSGGFLTGGAQLLSALFRPIELPVPLFFREAPPEMTRALGYVEGPVIETTWVQKDTSLLFTKGHSGQTIDLDTLTRDLLSHFAAENYAPLTAELVIAVPMEPDLEQLHRALYVEAKSAYFDPDQKKIVPAVTGKSFDIAAARGLLEGTQEGGTCSIPLALTPPEVTTEALSATLFRDKLSTCYSKVGGSNARVSNVKVASDFINDIILMPGEIFSYTNAVSPYTKENGYRPAPAYVNGETKDEMAGGICQVSSTLYFATLRANLKITERHHHTYAVGYVTDGMDATVYSDTLDFRFENDTTAPLKIVSTMENKKLTIDIYGTKTSDVTVKMESNRLSTLNYETIYKIDASVPVGTKIVDTTPYTGRKVEAYRCLYDGDGMLISRLLESVNNYKSRNQVIRINPADAGQYGVDPATGNKVDTPTAAVPSPTPGLTPTPTPGPTPAPTPGPTPTPEQSPPPGETPPLEPHPTPAPTPPQEGPLPTPTPPSQEVLPTIPDPE